ncbi:Rieske (2Fe-2S) protein [Streptomyces europaeiscabiei]|uniref:Cytochrome bc1 complex Rieske iron-sulfur subunit n=1 Tax=Streptomyces europaeiscabiei TaxID=146819 RepID=A0ABU4NUK4_9ACTN|nr:Rieske (2Fe-2S) protein [Streptomyces europaeiscabiei]MDX2529320.1 Rieske (2Fe-2S) protein [Streptomyces europaeiscabiei]MDX2763441.1 Rieske (2Fe-2S) protein [Streptomyces europaeiscabiei]MDX2771842.1 Rieske (2Fe-2S) protein [Streptomyces europaeiscabiei]MDX3549168.1 Rieske (2Fe-2S) protein [Streptomyces europaeiscabiei]MDX3558637.1 Rieske (2Fe-2S) protein [Streptomyces europaeiscabiei]
MTSETIKPASIPGRRTVMTAAGVAGLAVALTACGSGDDSSTSTSSGSGAGGDASSDSTAEAGSGSASGGDSAGGTAIAKTSDIPEGGGKIFESEGVVITQPEAGTYKAFSSSCTHRGCAVKSISDGVINCPCHNSNFSIADGSVKSGPAPKPLPAKEVSVSGDSITLA